MKGGRSGGYGCVAPATSPCKKWDQDEEGHVQMVIFLGFRDYFYLLEKI